MIALKSNFERHLKHPLTLRRFRIFFGLFSGFLLCELNKILMSEQDFGQNLYLSVEHRIRSHLHQQGNSNVPSQLDRRRWIRSL